MGELLTPRLAFQITRSSESAPNSATRSGAPNASKWVPAAHSSPGIFRQAPVGRPSRLLRLRGHHAEGFDLHILSVEIGLHFRPQLLVQIGIRPTHAKVLTIESDG